MSEKVERDFHQKKVSLISVEESWQAKDQIVIDVRTASEYKSGTFPGAINFPLFSEHERAAVGTIYKNMGKEEAIGKGYEYVDQKISELIKEIKQFDSNKTIVVMCARGGMRSRSVSALLIKLGYKSLQMTGGYKAFRNWILDRLEKISFNYPLVVLHGKTGVGKTIILNRLENSIDLEGLAQHRSSLLGGIGKIPTVQKNFEALLVKRIDELDHKLPIFIEGESRKVGKVYIPDALFAKMKKGEMVLLHAKIETRIQRIISDYVTMTDQNFTELEEALNSLRELLSNQKVDKLIQQLRKRELEKVIEYLFLNYYDSKYSHAMRNYNYRKELSAEDISLTVKRLIDIQQEIAK